MNINVREIGTVSVIEIEGRIDINSSEIIETIGWLVKNGRLNIVCNFEKVEIVDYSGLSILTIAYKNVTNHQGELKFCNIPLHVMELFRIVQLDTIFIFYANEEMALKSFIEPSEIEKKILRRRFKRVFVQIGVKYRILSREKDRNLPYHNGKVLNIGGEGIYIYSNEIFPIGTQLELEVSLGMHGKIIDLTGIVVWIGDKELQPHSYPGMGIQFLKLGPIIQKTILEYINKHITHRSGFSEENRF